MGSLPKPLIRALEPVIEAVRSVLRDLDPKEVPPSLRRVVAYTGKRLPPPLLKSLITELDRNEWLRTKVVEESGDVIDPLTAEFLNRSPGWWVAVAEQAVAAATVRPANDVSAHRDELRAQLSEAKRRIADLHAANADLQADMRSVRRERKAESDGREAASRVGALQRRLAELEVMLGDETKRRRESEDRLSELQRRRDRRERIRTAEQESTRRSVGLSDPVAAARRLDLQISALAAAVRGEAPSDIPAVAPDGEIPLPTLPPGVSPDSVDAIRWLLAEAEPLPVIVDGYNVSFLLAPGDFEGAEGRRRLIGELERLVRASRVDHRVIVVFDSSLAAADEPEMTPGGVEVRFATTAETADDEIVSRSAALAGRAIVITNDRELRERVGELGALALWGSALADWIAQR